MSLTFLVGAVLGSAIAVFAGRAPAYRLLAVAQKRYERFRRRI
jgi:hypothetical protein